MRGVIRILSLALLFIPIAATADAKAVTAMDLATGPTPPPTGSLLEQVTLQYANIIPDKDNHMVVSGALPDGKTVTTANYQVATVPPAVLAFLTGILGLAVVGRAKRRDNVA